MTTRICIRIDIDTIRDTEVLPVILGILDDYNIYATFFVTTGEDSTFRNYRNYLNPLKLLKNKAIKQHGIKQMLMGSFQKQQVQKGKNLKMIPEKGHELGLHGYLHYDWMNTLHKRSTEEIADWISKGIELFEHEFGFKPVSFASPGFASGEAFLEALDLFNFEYSSDFRGKEAFYPKTGNNNCSTLQLPVVEKSFGELEQEAVSEDDIYELYRKQLDNADDFLIFYMHPSYEPIINRNLLLKILDYITSDKRFKVVTMQQLANHVKKMNQEAGQ